MKFEIGDKVTVLHSNEEAEVVEMINDKMVLVDVRGVKFPAYIDQLDFPYFKRFLKRRIPRKKKQKPLLTRCRLINRKRPIIRWTAVGCGYCRFLITMNSAMK